MSVWLWLAIVAGGSLPVGILIYLKFFNDPPQE